MDVIDTDAFLAIAAPFTKTGPERMAAMVDAVRMIDDDQIAGDIVECGVWRGGNIMIARKVSPDRTCWLFDTFTGMTRPGEFDVSRTGGFAVDRYEKHMASGEGWCEASVAKVIECMRATGTYDLSKLRFVVGDVEQSLIVKSNIPDKIALLRLDTDWYASTLIELEILYPRLESGGVLIVDDYGHWPGAKKAVDEYFDGTGVTFDYIDYTAIMMVKP